MTRLGRQLDFIGLGAQKAGTSWIYACLYEHPEIYAPIKEIHFFSRERNWRRGLPWYESNFRRCPAGCKAGEFSTSYLVSPEAAQRIHQSYPQVKLIASLRNPMDRAFSNYLNDLRSGLHVDDGGFPAAIAKHPEYVDQGLYAEQLLRYMRLFPRDNLLVLIYEDSLKQPLQFIQSIYGFVGVDHTYVPSMLHERVNVGRVPRYQIVEDLVDALAQAMRKLGLDRLVWAVKRSGLQNRIRDANTLGKRSETLGLSLSVRQAIYDQVKCDIARVEEIIGRELQEWRP